MKKVVSRSAIAFCFFMAVSFILFSTVLTSITFSVETKLEEKTPAVKLSQGEIKQLQEGAATLGKAFGINPDFKKEEKQETKKETDAQQKKTFADVADKSLDLVKNLVISLSQTLEKVAPQIWRVMVKQQYARAIADLSLPWGLFLITVIYTFIIKRIWRWKPEYDNMPFTDNDDIPDMPLPTERGVRGFFTVIIPFIFGFIFAIWGCVVLKNSMLLLINPEYYAIRDLLLMIMNPSATP